MTGEVYYNQGNPLVYSLSGDSLKQGKHGRPELTVIGGSTEPIVQSYPIKYAKISGYLDAIRLYEWHQENGYEFDKEVIESNGNLTI